jgi:peptidoglycan/LPS O-acetylase OafA/YrhL
LCSRIAARMNAPRYKELDALRGFAALFVLFFHYTTHTPYQNRLLELGVTGVDLFFIISGFVIFMSINHVSSAREFIVNRFARLYPTYWASVTFTALLMLIVHHTYNIGEALSTFKYIGNMSMFQHYLRAGNIDGTYWTMIIEMVFYILILILFRMKALKYILHIGAALLLFTVAWDIWIEARFDFLYRTIRYIFPLINHFPLFLAGILFYKILHGEKSLWHYTLLAACLPVQIMLYNNGGSAYNYIGQWSYGGMLIFYFIVFAAFINQRLRFIVNAPALFFGKISFALYLVHQFVSIDVIIPLLTQKTATPYWAAALAAFTVSVGVSVFITYYIEVPLGKKIKALLLKREISHEVVH